MSAVITPPPGGKKRGRPPKADSLRVLALQVGVSVRSIERALYVTRHGVPELAEMVSRGELTLGPAAYVATWSHDEQRECCARGAEYLLELIPLVRIADAEEKGRQLAAKRQAVRRCPHCGGDL